MTDRKPRWSLEAAPPESGQAQAAGGAGRTVRLLGAWSLIAFVPHGRALAAELSALARDPGVGCALREVDPLDRAGAVLLWRVWGRRTPARLALRPARMPWKEISANLYRTGSQAAGIAALVGFLIGIVLSCLSGKQLQQWVPYVFIVNLPGIAVIRERGPVLAAILVAGRSGSAITAQIGVMRVTQELDAMTVMGIPHDRRLILPRAIALAIAMPLLILWTSAMALIGGMPAAEVELGLNHSYFIDSLRTAVPIANCWMGLGKGVVFGILLAALVAVAVWFRQDAVVRDRYLLVAASSVSGLDVQASLRLRGAAIGSVFGGTLGGVAGCALDPAPGPPVTLHDFGLAPVPAQASPRIHASMAVPEAAGPAGLDTTAIVNRLVFADGGQPRVYARSRWAGTPGEMITARLRARDADRRHAPGHGDAARVRFRAALAQRRCRRRSGSPGRGQPLPGRGRTGLGRRDPRRADLTALHRRPEWGSFRVGRGAPEHRRRTARMPAPCPRSPMTTLFEKIIRREIPARIVHEDDLCLAFHDIDPQAPVHVLLIPKKPLVDLAAASAGDQALLGHLMLTAARVAAQLDIGDAFRLNVNNGAGAGQSVFHLHLHILGGRPFSWPPG